MGELFIVPTPIGNLKDISFRALEVLTNSYVVLAEDTRKTRTILKHYNINTRLKSYHQHNEHKIVDQLVSEIKTQDQTYALVSDAGTPGISDPGYLLIRGCLRENITVKCLPGATAFVPALIQSGFPCDRFVFEGFLPRKKGRLKRLIQLQKEKRTIIFYESPHRLMKFLDDIQKYLGSERSISISREISKVYEETINGKVTELISHFSKKPLKGEFVIIVEGEK